MRQLRQLIDRELTNHLADAGDPRVVADLEDRAILFIERLELRLLIDGGRPHRPELHEVEHLAAYGKRADFNRS